MKPSAFPPIVAALCAFAAFLPPLALAQAGPPAVSVRARYTKSEFYIPMRDGVNSTPSFFSPGTRRKRTRFCWSERPMDCRTERTTFPDDIGPSEELMRSGYIFAHQDVRGTHLSEGDLSTFARSYPPIMGQKRSTNRPMPTIRSTIWSSIRRATTGAVGMWGISYPGFYADCGAISGHPALVAVSPQAPLTDWFAGDDEHHNGAFYLMDDFDWEWTFDFDYPRKSLTRGYPQPHHKFTTDDAYAFYLALGPAQERE